MHALLLILTLNACVSEYETTVAEIIGKHQAPGHAPILRYLPCKFVIQLLDRILHDLLTQSAVTRRAEYDANNVLKKPAYRPKAKRYTTETLPDRELALLAMLALWRADVHWIIDGISLDRKDRWIGEALDQWQAPADYSVRLALARTIRYIQDGLQTTPSDSYPYRAGLAWLMHTA